MSRQVLIFVKEPVIGKVKTRLAAEIGTRAACQAYRRCVERTLEQLAPLREDTTLCIAPADATGRMAAWLGAGWTMRPQQGATLGARLANAIQDAATCGAGPIVVIGSDSPWITCARVEAAFAQAHQADLVLGPAADGGYYLIGLARPVPALFSGIAWSTGRVLHQTLARAGALGLTVALLPEGYDVDQLTDLRRWMREDARHGLTRSLLTQRRRMAYA